MQQSATLVTIEEFRQCRDALQATTQELARAHEQIQSLEQEVHGPTVLHAAADECAH